MLERNMIREIGKKKSMSLKIEQQRAPSQKCKEEKRMEKQNKQRKQTELTPKNCGKISKRFNMHITGISK